MSYLTLRRLVDNRVIFRRSVSGDRSRARSSWLISLCLIAASPLTLAPLTSALLTRFERTSLNNRNDIAGFIALGGGEERILEAARLARAHPGAKLVITGQGDGAVLLGRQSGLPAEQVVIEPAARNTFENAQFTARLLGPNASAHWVLVTSASHMPRAIGCFRKAAIHIEPWPIADVSNGWRDKLSSTTHEWLGMLAYWLVVRTDALFPSRYDHSSGQVIAAANSLRSS
jgi:uncharacterized SAM-binding protein YcdF (DUF218 family)